MFLSWEQETAEGRKILVGRRNRVTRAWQGITEIMDVLVGSASPTIGMDVAGNAWVVANRFDDENSAVIARRFNAEQQVWEDEITIGSAASPAAVGGAQVAVSQSGSAVVVWSHKDSSGSSTLRARAYE
jgi:hypothetical protein